MICKGTINGVLFGFPRAGAGNLLLPKLKLACACKLPGLILIYVHVMLSHLWQHNAETGTDTTLEVSLLKISVLKRSWDTLLWFPTYEAVYGQKHCLNQRIEPCGVFGYGG